VRITGFSIDGFGIFHNLSLKGLSSGLVVFLGENEAGKSTLLAFFRSILFGFPDRRSRERPYPVLSGGSLGGTVVLESGSLGEVSVERRAGPRGGILAVRAGAGAEYPMDGLAVLFGGTTPELFKNVYAFSLNELQTFETLGSDAVRGAIYGAAAGTGILALPRAQAEIERRLGELFKSTGTIPALNRKLVEIEEIRGRLGEASRCRDLYEAKIAELRDSEGRIEGLRREESTRRAERARAETRLKLLEVWPVLQEVEAGLTALPMVVESFPEDGVARLDALSERLREREEEVASLELELHDLRRQEECLAVDPELLAREEELRALSGERQSFAAALARLPVLQQALEIEEDEIRRVLAGLGREWSEQKVLEFDRSLFTRESVVRHQEGLQDARTRMARAEQALKMKEDEQREARAAEVRAREKMDGLRDPGMEADPETIRCIEADFVHFQALRRDLPQKRRMAADARRHLVQAIHEIDSSWGEAELDAFDCSIHAQETVKAFEDRLNGLRQRLAAVELRLHAELDTLHRASGRLSAKIEELRGLGGGVAANSESLIREREAIKSLDRLSVRGVQLDTEMAHIQGRIEERRRDRQALEEEAAGLRPLAFWAWLAPVLGGTLVAALLWTRPGLKAEALVIGAASAAVVFAFLFWRERERASRQRIQARRLVSVAAEMDDLEQRLAGAARRKGDLDEDAAVLWRMLSLSGPPGLEELDRLERRNERARAAGDVCTGIQREIEEIRRSVDRSETAAAALEEERDGLRLALEEAEQAWAGHVRCLGLAEGTSPRTAGLVFSKIAAAKTLLQRVEELEGEVEGMEQETECFVSRARTVPALFRDIEEGYERVEEQVAGFLARTRARDEMRQEHRLAEIGWIDAAERAAAAERAFDAASGGLAEALAEEQRRIGLWQEWLESSGLPPGLSPVTAADALGMMEQCAGLLEERDRIQREIEGTAKVLEDCFEQARMLFLSVRRPPPEMEDLVTLLDRLEEDLKRSQNDRARREQLLIHITRIEDRIDAARRGATHVRSALAALMDAGGSRDEEEFRTRARWYLERRRFLEEKDRLEARLKGISGEQDINGLTASLPGFDQEMLRLEVEESSRRIEEIGRELQSEYERRAAVQLEIRGLASSDEVSRLRAEEARVLEEMHALAREWARHAAARHLIRRAKSRFEQEQQPKVIRDAGDFLRTITGGRYRQIIAPIGGDAVEVVGDDGRRKTLDELSRGTAEQLYLALRFGHIVNYAVNGETLPVIMDDILVNFDPKRAGQSVAAISLVARTHQVLFFTCHPETAGRLAGAAPEACLYRIHGGGVIQASRGVHG